MATNRPWQVLTCRQCNLTLENCKCHPMPCMFCKEEFGSIRDWNIHIDECHDKEFTDAVIAARKKQPVLKEPFQRDVQINVMMLNCMKLMLVGLCIILASFPTLVAYIVTTNTNFRTLSIEMFVIGMIFLIGGSYYHGRLYNLQKKIREERIMKERSEKVYQYFWDDCTNIKSHEEFAKSGFMRCSLCGYPKNGKKRGQ